MAFCAQCGASIQPGTRFCEKCGTPVGTVVPPTLRDAPAGSGMPENIASALCYLLWLITGILFLLLEPYNRNKRIRFHAFQSIFLGLAWMVFWMAMTIVFHRLAFFLAPLVSIAGFCLWLYLIVTAYQGKKIVLPVIGPLAEKQVG